MESYFLILKKLKLRKLIKSSVDNQLQIGDISRFFLEMISQ